MFCARILNYTVTPPRAVIGRWVSPILTLSRKPPGSALPPPLGLPQSLGLKLFTPAASFCPSEVVPGTSCLIPSIGSIYPNRQGLFFADHRSPARKHRNLICTISNPSFPEHLCSKGVVAFYEAPSVVFPCLLADTPL